FDVLLNGTFLQSSTQHLYGSRFSPGSQFTLRPGEWMTAAIKFKLENKNLPNDQLLGKSKLSVKWNQETETRHVSDCKVMNGYFKHIFEQDSPTKTIRIARTR